MGTARVRNVEALLKIRLEVGEFALAIIRATIPLTMDAPTSAAVIAGLTIVGKPAAELVKNLVERVLGPAADAYGQSLKEWVEQRHKRAEQTLYEAGRLLHDAGIEPQGVPGRILLPILKRSSLADQPELQRKWAALLANAATPGFDEILPAYAEILSQLTPAHVNMLDQMTSSLWQRVGDKEERFYDFYIEQKAVQDLTRLSEREYLILAADLHRMNLIASLLEVGHTVDPGLSGIAFATDYHTLRMTHLGIAFIEACQAPAPKMWLQKKTRRRLPRYGTDSA